MNSDSFGRRARGPAVIILCFIAGIALFALLARIGYTLFFMAIFSRTCSDKIASETASPNEKLKAVVYVRDCGATTRASTKVVIVPRSQARPRYSDDIVFSGYEVPWDAKEHKVSLEWRSDRQLKIKYKPDVELTQLKNYVRKVHVDFELTPEAP